MGCFSECLMSSASIQKLFCEIYSAFKCSFDEFVGEKVVFPSYSSAILGPPVHSFFKLWQQVYEIGTSVPSVLKVANLKDLPFKKVNPNLLMVAM